MRTVAQARADLLSGSVGSGWCRVLVYTCFLGGGRLTAFSVKIWAVPWQTTRRETKPCTDRAMPHHQPGKELGTHPPILTAMAGAPLSSEIRSGQFFAATREDDGTSCRGAMTVWHDGSLELS